MAQPGLCLNSGRLTTRGHKLQTTNSGSIKAKSSMSSFESISKDKQCTYFQSHFSKTPEKKSSIPWLDTTRASDNSDNYSDSDSEAENRRNVTRWLESLPINQEWYDIEDDLSSRQGDFQKETTSNIESLSKNAIKEKLDPAHPSTSFKNDSSSSSWEPKGPKNKLSKSKEAKSKTSTEKIKSVKLKVHFKETPTEIRSENSRYSQLSVRQESQLQSSSESFEKSKNLGFKSISKTDSKDLSTSDENNDEKVETRKYAYNLRSLESRKIDRQFEARMSDSEEKNGRPRRSCSIRCQEYKRKSREISSTNGQERRNEYYQVENLKPPRKLKSPFTKQASSSKTPGLFIGTPCMSSYKLNECKETKQNVQKLDRGTGKQKQLERKVIVRSKVARNRKLLKTVKDLVNVIENNPDPVHKTYFLRKSRKSGNEEIRNSRMTTSMQSDEELRIGRRVWKDVSENKPTFVNSKLETKLDEAMEAALNRYKRSYGNKEAMLNERSSDQLGEPPRKKNKRPVY